MNTNFCILTWCDAVKRCFGYYIRISPSAAFVSSMVISYYLVELTVVGVLSTYLTDSLDTPNGRSGLLVIAATLNKVHGGLTAIFELILIFTSDSHIGGFKTLLFSTASYITGLTILVFWERTPYSERLVYNTVAIFYLAIGCGGKETLRKFLSEQLRAEEPKGEPVDEDRVEARTRVWYRAAWLIAAVVSMFVNFGDKKFVYSASAMAFSYLVFSCGICFYHRKKPSSRKQDFIENCPDHQEQPMLLRTNGNHVEDAETSTVTIERISSFGQAMQQCKSKSVIMFMLPTWGFSIMLGIGVATAETFFQQQAEPLQFPFDITALLLLKAISGTGFIFLYDLILSKCQPTTDAEITRSGKMMRSSIKIWIGMLLMVSCLLVAWRVEAYMKYVANEYVIPKLALWLALQFVLFGLAETFSEDGLNNLLDLHLPADSLKKYGSSLNKFAIGGLGNFFSIVLLQGLRHWFSDDLNRSRLDRYFLLVAMLNFLNLCSSIILWRFFKGMDDAGKQTQSQANGSLEMTPVTNN